MRHHKKGIFITGTDTGVGKTYIAAGIAKELRSRGVDVGVMKPAETGCRVRAGKLVPADSRALMRAAGVRDALDLVNPCRFRKPLAPSVAARLEGRMIDLGMVMRAFRELRKRHDFLIVEGAGGIMVPLWEDRLFIDLAERMGLPVLIVARPGLGTINHTLLTVAALQQRKLPLAGIVINHAVTSRQDLATRTNPGVIEELSGTGIPRIVPHGSRDLAQLADLALQCR